MCDFVTGFWSDGVRDLCIKCTHPDYGSGKDEGKTFCIFHNDREDKDVEKFYKGFKKLYKSGKHYFRGFIFPKDFSFKRLREETGDLEFKEADFSCATFSGEVFFVGTMFSGNTGFTNTTFLGEAQFWEVTFPGWADFSGVTFSGVAYFEMATFSEGAYFWEATFSEFAFFFNTVFSGRADFKRATFSGGTNFSDAKFSGLADFEGVTFSREADFCGVRFSEKVDFTVAIFSIGADFRGAIFSGEAHFGDTTFSGEADFKRATFSGEANFSWATLSGKVDFERVTFSGGADFRWATFSGSISFWEATFSGMRNIVFTGRTFYDDGQADFRNVHFEHPENVTFDRVDLGRCRFLWTDLSKIKFTKVYWCGRRYKSSSYFGRIKVFDERLQEKGRLIRWPALLMQKMGVWKIPLKFVELFRPKKPPQEDKKIRMYFRDLYFQFLTFLKVAASEKEKNHYEVHRLYNQLIDNYERTNRYHEAGDFFAGMMEMRRRESFEKIRIRIALWFYRLFSLYGERPAFAMGWLAILIFVSGLFTLNFGITSANPGSEISRNIFELGELFEPGFWTEYLQALFVSLRIFTLGRVETAYYMSDPIWGPLIQIVEMVLGAVFLSLFILAMNRKFRRMKD